MLFLLLHIIGIFVVLLLVKHKWTLFNKNRFIHGKVLNRKHNNRCCCHDQAPTDSLVIDNITLDTDFTIELFYKTNPNSIGSPGYNGLFQLNSPSEVHYNMGNIWLRSLQGALWVHSNWTSDSGGWFYNNSIYIHADNTEYHLVLGLIVIQILLQNIKIILSSYQYKFKDRTTTYYEIFTLGGATGRQASSNGTTSGQEPTFVNRSSLNQEGNYYYLRFYNTALTANHVNTLLMEEEP